MISKGLATDCYIGVIMEARAFSRRNFLQKSLVGVGSAWLGAAWPEVLAAQQHAHHTMRAVDVGTPAKNAEFDFILSDAHIVDGTGAPWVAGDLGISGDRIAAIGDLSGASAKKRVDVKGLVVAPGFIDVQGQSEFNVGRPRPPWQTSFRRVPVGNPARRRNREEACRHDLMRFSNQLAFSPG